MVRVQYDSSIVLGPKNSSTWTDIPVDVLRSISIRRGKTQENQVVQPGECTIVLDNRSGDFDPMNQDSPYWISLIPSVGGYSYWSTNLGIRVVASWEGNDYVIYQGYLEQLSLDYGLNPTVSVTFVDALAWIAKQQIPAIPSTTLPEGLGDPVWARFDRILDKLDGTAGFPSALRYLDFSVNNTLYGTRYGQDALSLLQTAADCGPGRFFVDAEGRVRLLAWDGGFDAGLTLSDSQAFGTVGYDIIEVDPGSKYLLNFVTINKIDADGNVTGSVSAADADSELRFGPSQAVYDLPTNTAEGLANFLANQYSEPFDRVRLVAFSHTNLGGNFIKTLLTDLGDYVTVERTTYDGRSLQFFCQVEGIEHEITPSTWTMSYICSTIDANLFNNYWVQTFTSDFYIPDYEPDGDLAVAADDTQYVTGSLAESGGAAFAFLAKSDSLGAVQWQKFYGDGDYTRPVSISVHPTGANVTGWHFVGLTSQYSIWVLSVSNDGSLLWHKRILTGLASPTKNVTDSDGNVLIAATVSGGYLAKFDSSGTTVWQRQLAISNFIDVAVDDLNYFYAVGIAESGSDLITVIAGYEPTGVLRFQKSLSAVLSTGPAYLVPRAMCITPDGDAVFLSLQYDSSSSAISVVVRVDSFGNEVWRQIFDVNAFRGCSLKADNDGNLYIVTGGESASTPNNYFVIKCDLATGDIVWARSLSLSGDVARTGLGVDVDSRGNIRVTGSSGGYYWLSACLPPDGSKTGSYSVGGKTFYYQAVYPTTMSLDLAWDTSTYADSAASASIGTPSLTLSPGSLTTATTAL